MCLKIVTSVVITVFLSFFTAVLGLSAARGLSLVVAGKDYSSSQCTVSLCGGFSCGA